MQAPTLTGLKEQLVVLTEQRDKLASALAEVTEKIEIVEYRYAQLNIEQESVTPEGSGCTECLLDVEGLEEQEGDEKNDDSKEFEVTSKFLAQTLNYDHIKVSSPDYRVAYDGAFTSYLLNIPPFQDSVERRYKQFSWLHNQLAGAYPNVRVPELPERVCGRARFNPGFIAQRCTELEVYINKVVSHETLSRHPDVWVFLHADTETIARALKEKWDDDEPYRPLTETGVPVTGWALFSFGSKLLKNVVEPKVMSAKGGQLAMFEMTTVNIAQSQALYVAAKLGIADILWRNRRSMTVHELAQETKTNENCLYRVLRFLGLSHIFDVDFESNSVTLNSISRHLVSVHPFSALAGVIIMNEEQFTSLSHLLHAVKTGQIPFNHIYGTDVWSYYSLREESNINFDLFMTGLNAIPNLVIPEDYDFSSCSSVADIGGGQGHLLLNVLKYNKDRKDMKGILFDQPQVLNDNVKHSWEAYGDRVKLVPGNFFEDNMPKADIYMLRMILHDWEDSKAIAILSNLSRAMSLDSKLLIIEQLITTDGSDPLSSIKTGSDLIMMAVTGGKERTEIEYSSLLDSSGLTLTNIIPTRSTMTIIEAQLKNSH